MKHSELSPLAQKLRAFMLQQTGNQWTPDCAVSPEWNKEAIFIQQLLDERTRECSRVAGNKLAELLVLLVSTIRLAEMSKQLQDAILAVGKPEPKWCEHYQWRDGGWLRQQRFKDRLTAWVQPKHDAKFCDICGAPRPKE